MLMLGCSSLNKPDDTVLKPVVYDYLLKNIGDPGIEFVTNKDNADSKFIRKSIQQSKMRFEYIDYKSVIHTPSGYQSPSGKPVAVLKLQSISEREFHISYDVAPEGGSSRVVSLSYTNSKWHISNPDAPWAVQ